MNITLYRDKDIDAITSYLPILEEKIDFLIKDTYEPTTQEWNQVMQAILEYIRKNNCIIYGGTALNELIPDKSQKIYNQYSRADIEFYSHKPLTDLKKLCDFLHKKNFKYVRGSDGLHKETFKVFVNFINYCDISYIPENILSNIPTISKFGYTYIHPHIMFLDKLRMFNDPLGSAWRFDKEIKRLKLILKYFPLKKLDCKLLTQNTSTYSNILNFIRKIILPKFSKHNMVTGYYAYFYYMAKSNLNNPYNDESVELNVPYYEIISGDYDQTIQNIYSELSSKFSNITFTNFYPFSQFQDKHTEFYYNKNIVLSVFSNNHVCAPFTFLPKKHIKISTFTYTLMFLLANKLRFSIFSNNESLNMECMISNMIDARHKYLEDTDKTVVDESPFQDFIFSCIGKYTDLARERMLNVATKKTSVKRISYDPISDKKEPSVIFDDSSGTPIKFKYHSNRSKK